MGYERLGTNRKPWKAQRCGARGLSGRYVSTTRQVFGGAPRYRLCGIDWGAGGGL